MNASIKILVLFFLLNSLHNNLAQVIQTNLSIPKDTSFTLFSATQKIRKDFPKARPVLPNSTKGITEKKNITYTAYGERKLHLDLFFPSKMYLRKFPAVILVHGGGWQSGDRSMETPMAQRLAAEGYVTATVEYRLSPEAKYPAAIYDLKAAVRWLRANAKKYNIDIKKIAAYGCSSGGHLVSFLGTTNGNKKFEGNGWNLNYSSRIQAVIDIDGILDFTDPAESGKDNDPAKPSVGKLWLDYSFKENPEIWIEASPITHVDKNTPPFIFINSSLERFHAGREILIEKLNTFDTYSEVHTIPNTPHPFWLFHPWFEETFDHIRLFLNKTFKNL